MGTGVEERRSKRDKGEEKQPGASTYQAFPPSFSFFLVKGDGGQRDSRVKTGKTGCMGCWVDREREFPQGWAASALA